MNDKVAAEEKEVIVKVKAMLEERKWLTQGTWTNKEITFINSQFYLTAK